MEIVTMLHFDGSMTVLGHSRSDEPKKWKSQPNISDFPQT